MLLDVWIHQGDIHPERVTGCIPAFPDLLTQQVRKHAPASDKTETSCVTHSRRQTPATVPDHAGLYDRITYPEQAGNCIGKFHLTKVRTGDSLFFLILHKKLYLGYIYKLKACTNLCCFFLVQGV